MDRSPVTWLTDAKYSTAPLSERIVAWADSQVGVREHGWNKGPEVVGYQSAAGLGSKGGFAWCAAFVYWCCERAGADMSKLPPRGKCAAVRNWRVWAIASGLGASVPDRGVLFYWLNRDGTGHIGICLSKPKLGVFRTIEGNTDSGAGSREGDGVYKRTRTTWGLAGRHRFGFIDVGRVEKLAANG